MIILVPSDGERDRGAAGEVNMKWWTTRVRREGGLKLH
jgi:hypothetical protein